MASGEKDQNLFAGYFIGAVVFIGCILIALFGPTKGLSTVLCLLGGASGWVVGIVATPKDEDDKAGFSNLTRGLLTLGSGYLVGKLADDVAAAVSSAIKQSPEQLEFNAFLFLTCFMIGLLYTLVTRLYGVSIEDKRVRSKERCEGLRQKANILLRQAAECNKQADEIENQLNNGRDVEGPHKKPA